MHSTVCDHTRKEDVNEILMDIVVEVDDDVKWRIAKQQSKPVDGVPYIV